MVNLTSLIPQIGEISRIYNNVAVGRGVSCEDALALGVFAQSSIDCKEIEAELVGLVLNYSPEQRQLLVKGLNDSLKSIVNTYNEFKPLFDRIGLSELWSRLFDENQRNIADQMKRVNETKPELREVSNSIEMSPFNGASKEEIRLLEKRYERLKADYDTEKKKLTKLYEEEQRIKDEMFSVGEETFSSVTSKCQELLTIVEKYVDDSMPTADEDAGNEDAQSATPNIAYMPLELVSHVFQEVNGEQFVPMNEDDFFHAINLHSNAPAIRIVEGEKNRTYYILYKFWEKIDEKLRPKWLTGILEQLGIKRKIYASKYRKVVSEDASDTDKKFVESIDAVFKQ